MARGFVVPERFGTRPGAAEALCRAAAKGYLTARVTVRAPNLRSQQRHGFAYHTPRPTGAIAMSMKNVASPAIPLPPPKRNLLAHIPGNEGWPVVGRTLSILADPKGEVERMAAKYGLVYWSRVLGETSLSVLGPEDTALRF